MTLSCNVSYSLVRELPSKPVHLKAKDPTLGGRECERQTTDKATPIAEPYCGAGCGAGDKLAYNYLFCK